MGAPTQAHLIRHSAVKSQRRSRGAVGSHDLSQIRSARLASRLLLRERRRPHVPKREPDCARAASLKNSVNAPKRKRTREGACGVQFSPCQNEAAGARRPNDRRRVRGFGLYLVCWNSARASSRNHQWRLYRWAQFVQLRDPLGARRSLHKDRSAARGCHRRGALGGARTPLGRSLPSDHRAGSFRRAALSLRGARLRIRRRCELKARPPLSSNEQGRRTTLCSLQAARRYVSEAEHVRAGTWRR